MAKFRLAHLGLVVAALGFTAAAPVVGLAPAYAAETLRPEVGKPLQEAQQLMKSGKNKDALAKLRDLDKVGGKSANETYLIERTRAGAASVARRGERGAPRRRRAGRDADRAPGHGIERGRPAAVSRAPATLRRHACQGNL